MSKASKKLFAHPEVSKPITTLEEGKRFIELLVETKTSFHLEDSPSEIITLGEGNSLFTKAQCPVIEQRVAELYSLEWGPELQCPIGYLLELESPNWKAD